MDIDRIKRLDSAICKSVKDLNVLKLLAWPQGEIEKFLDSWNKKNVRLPTPQSLKVNFSSQISELEDLKNQCDQSNPLEKFLFETADSYALAARMLENYGTKGFTEYSARIYGRPDDQYESLKESCTQMARNLLDVTDHLMGNFMVPEAKSDISPQQFAEWMKSEVDEFFTEDQVKVVIDDKISARAIAGSKKIKISEDAKFSDLDKAQLLNHEAFIHTATILNGKKQNVLTCLSLGAPRTTRNQEGLAVFSELMTRSMDIIRLRRLALRVIAVKMALDGADFVELFKFFLDEGQRPGDAAASAQRIFRGGDVKGGVVFTKDSVYLEAVFGLHAFIKIAIMENRVDLIKNLFCGRLTLADSIRLSPYFESGLLAPPVYLPEWARDFSRLGALMAYSAFSSKIDMDKLSLESFIELEDKRKNRLLGTPGPATGDKSQFQSQIHS